jgi:cell wall-associated NlpC family hydrolase
VARDNNIRRTAGIPALCTFLAAALLLITAGPARATPPPPPNPSDQDIIVSQSAATGAAARIGHLAGLVTTTQGNITRLRNDLELKAELVKKALIDVQIADADAAAAQADAVTAAQTAAHAGSQVSDAQSKAAAFAAASYRQGSVLGSVTALLNASGAQDLLGRDQMLHYLSARQLDVIAHLQESRTEKVNLDSDARSAQDQATAAQQRAQQLRQQAQTAQQDAAAAFISGQASLAAMQSELRQQDAAYGLALSKVASLQGERQQYNQWLAAKKAEEEQARRQAALRAQQAAAAAAQVAAQQAAAQQQAAEQAAIQRAAAAQAAADRDLAAKAAADRQAAAKAAALRTAAAQAQANQAAAAKTVAQKIAASTAAAERAAAAKAATTRAAADRAAATQAARAKAAADKDVADAAAKLTAAKQAQQRLARQKAAANNKVYYADCAAAEAAGPIPIKRGSPGYRIGLDRDHNGVACETLPDSASRFSGGKPAPAASPAPAVVYYSSCADAELAGVTPIRKGSPGYRNGLDTNRNGIACEILNTSGSPGNGGSSAGTPPSPTVNSGVAASRNDLGNSAPGAWSADKGQRAVQAAIRWVGTPYSWGGGNSSGPTTGICGPNGAENDCNIIGFDCSGLTSYAWAQVGINVPSLSVYQYTLGQHISTDNLLPGDFLFYANDTSDPSTIHHVSMYMGNGQMIEAPYSGAFVQIVPVTFGNGYIGATRPGT